MNNAKRTKLIKLVQRYECLYNVNDVDYKNTGKKKILWQKIAKILKVPTATVMNDWKFLRLGYIKHKRLTSASETSKKSYNYKWSWAPHLTFLESKLEAKPKNYPWEQKLRQEQEKDSSDGDDKEVTEEEPKKRNCRSTKNTYKDDENDSEEEMSADDSSSSVIEVEVTSPARACPRATPDPEAYVARISPTTGLYPEEATVRVRPPTIQYPVSATASAPTLGDVDVLAINESQPAPVTGQTTSTPLPEGKDWQNAHFKNILDYLKSKDNPNDPDELLLASYATTMKSLDRKTQTIVKIELAKIFAAAELEDLKA